MQTTRNGIDINTALGLKLQTQIELEEFESNGWSRVMVSFNLKTIVLREGKLTSGHFFAALRGEGPRQLCRVVQHPAPASGCCTNLHNCLSPSPCSRSSASMVARCMAWHTCAQRCRVMMAGRVWPSGWLTQQMWTLPGGTCSLPFRV